MLDEDDSIVYEVMNRFVLYNFDLGDGRYWLFDIEEGSIFNLNESSYFILSCFDGENSLHQVYQSFRNRYPNQHEQTLLHDFAGFCNALIAKGVLVESHRGGEGS